MLYRNITEETLSIPGFGEVEPGATIELSGDVNSPNLEIVDPDEKPF